MSNRTKFTMEVNVNKLWHSIHSLREHIYQPMLLHCDYHDEVLRKFERIEYYTERDMQNLFDYLSKQLLESGFAQYIAVNFEEFLLLLLSKSIPCNDKPEEEFDIYQNKCIALADLMSISDDAKRYATKYFRGKPAPFENLTVDSMDSTPPAKKKRACISPMLKCCYQLLSSNAAYFKELWDWSKLVTYCLQNQNKLGNDTLEQLYFNHILAILTNMSTYQLSQLNAKIEAICFVEFNGDQCSKPKFFDYQIDYENDEIITYNFQSDDITNIEGVLLPIYNVDNFNFYAESNGVYEELVKVDSTKVNLRSIALGIASAKTICLSGPVGCGKTTLVQYLARKTGRICPKVNEIAAQKRLDKENCVKRNAAHALEDLLDLNTKHTTGFLRIQLGDQTDSKMLLGQYRCTDVPGEFIWLPGILTQAVMQGYWLLLEDLDAATQDTFTILSGLLENNYLSVPGFRDCVKIEPGFQLFVTVRTNKSTTNSAQKALFSLLEKYLYTINILPLSRNELCKVVSTNYPKLATVANRIVDVFLTFSSGDHGVADNLRQQETNDKADNTTQYIALPFEPVSLAAVPNAGRLVSTRDLIKLCQRSNPMFSVTSTECAYFVFQNAVDVFCANLPQGKEKTKLVVSIGAKLGIIQSRCETYADDYKPEVTVDKQSIKVGRAELFAKSTIALETEDEERTDTKVTKRQKLTRDAEKAIVPLQQRIAATARVTFSFTRLAACLLERIAVCVAHAEPVLLVGETGVGKTSSVQYLAERTQHKLVVVNMNNQSDVSDLIGGYKPVDLSYVLMPLRVEFEALFCATFNNTKNADFLNKLSTCYNQSVFSVIVKMMIKVCNSALLKWEKHEIPQSIITLLPRWQQLKTKLLRLESQLSKAINISFAFIPGSLVNCIKNGDWVLLDELNLASAETLECLSTILEPDGSVVLLEKGDFTPVRRHADFRIFACMNPSTDIGKKDLPVGIRNRFTEFFVDELTTDNDLSLLISDYLSNTGIQRKSVTNIVKLYKRLRQLASLELNDGLGNRPVYSLRTLCRSLRICAKNLCGSIERNLYESFCLSFLTQLDAESHQKVLGLIKSALLTNEKSVLRQSIPKPGEHYLDFEGYWIQQGPRQLQECANYILTDSVKANLKDLARIISIGKLPILLQGPTSAGKTSLIEYVAKRSGNHCLRINNHEHTDLQEYIGTYVADVSGKLSFREGVLVQAMRNGYWIILDELNLASTEILEALNRVLDDNRELYIPETQTVVKAHANFMLFATQNPPGLYGGRKTLSRAFKNRFIELHFAEIPRDELEIILERRCLIPASYAKKMVMCMSDLQKNRKTTTKNVFTLRDLFRWGNRYTFADKALLENKSYDWNQHLIEEGYLVLSAKVRTAIEIEIIEDALYRNFKKRIDLARLFDVTTPSEQRSAVTANILAAIQAYTARNDIVWTRNMTRMAVLTAKALQFDEPVLLVGPTGCGKTTVCQILAGLGSVQLRILNCHMHTEGADFLGGLRPCRLSSDDEESGVQTKLFEWADGPLIHAMQEGSYFMADEISLAEDSVLERLNCILEPERTVLLAEKGGIAVENNEDANDAAAIASDFVVQAKPGFQFLATMNPGGDFGKKELSPALRNRFTEIWCLPSVDREDLIQIAGNCLSAVMLAEEAQKIARYLVEVVLYMRDHVEKFKFSIRDILAWAHYMVSNASLSFPERAIFGLETIFLDALEMLPHESIKQVDQLRNTIVSYAIKKAATVLDEHFTYADVDNKRGQAVLWQDGRFGLKPFLIPVNATLRFTSAPENFSFSAPTTKQNLFRLLSALSLQKPILLEGPPGVGKTSTVESLAKAIGFHIVRINLCEHTDLADLFGTDLPAEDNILSAELESENTKSIGSFIWRDGPLLAALKADNTWILLDELNLAPQSVLEGLNAILDHRGEVFIPELNRTFSLNSQTRIFACQNPLKQGGGRKGLPQSFLNRFNKVYLRKLTTEDLLHVIDEKYGARFEMLKEELTAALTNCVVPCLNLFDLRRSHEKILYTDERNTTRDFIFDLSVRLVKFSEQLDLGIASMEFGYKGGPYEINLRDILRWCDFFIDPQTGIHLSPVSRTSTGASIFLANMDSFLQTLYDTMKLVYAQRMRTTVDKIYISSVFAKIFRGDSVELDGKSEDISLYWTDEKLYLNDLAFDRDMSSTSQRRVFVNKQDSPILLATQRESLQNIIACVQHQKPVLLCGATDTGKTKLIDVVCTLSNQICNTDNIDDSVTGSFQQIDLNRHLEELALSIESNMFSHIQRLVLQGRKQQSKAAIALEKWYLYTMSWKTFELEQNHDVLNVSKELLLFQKRIEGLLTITEYLQELEMDVYTGDPMKIDAIQAALKLLQHHTRNADSLNMGGSFEWVDSKIVKSLKRGQYIALEHVNLCSSAVLDRLNPIFEPNGNLLISEKGVTATDTAEIVEKSPNFRAFLTIDPKNGELSRAMRNRCVELSLQKDAYSLDDLRQISHAHGVRDITAINCVIEMHKQIKALTEINNYNVSHLTQCAFLVAAYKRIGFATSRAIYVSGMEVYVYAANMDLMGYGLSYYQNKLRDIVLGHTQQYKHCIKAAAEESIARYGDYLTPMILRCSELNNLTMIQLQCAPLKLLLQRPKREELNAYLECFQHMDIDITHLNSETFSRYYIYMLYQCSCKADLTLRSLYFETFLTEELQRFSSKLYEEMEKCKPYLPAHSHVLPWNHLLFPNIRDYTKSKSNCIKSVFGPSGALIAHLLLQELPAANITKLNRVSALDYSRALQSNCITEKSNNKFLKHLATLCGNLHKALYTELRSSKMDESTWVVLPTNLLWLNRLISLADKRLFIDNDTIDTNLVDKLILHYEWLRKHLLRWLTAITGENVHELVGNVFRETDYYIKGAKLPLNDLSKFYVKHIMNFQAYHKDEQLKLHELSRELDNLLSVIPSYGTYTAAYVQRKFKAQKEAASTKARGMLNETRMYNIPTFYPNTKMQSTPEALKVALQDYSEILMEQQHAKPENNAHNIDSTDFDELKQAIECVRNTVNSSEELTDAQKPKDNELGLLAIKEHYLTKALVQSVQSLQGECLNLIYCEELPHLGNETWQLLRIYAEPEHKAYLAALNQVLEYIKNISDVHGRSFKNLMRCLDDSYKHFNVSWRNMLRNCQKQQLNNLSLRFHLTQINQRNDVELEIKPQITYDGPPLTNACLSLLFKSDGSFRPVPLNELNNWQQTLSQLRQLMWQNSLIATRAYNQVLNNLRIAQLHGRKLLHEIEHSEIGIPELKCNIFRSNLERQLNRTLILQRPVCSLQPHDALWFLELQYHSSNLHATIAMIELEVLLSLPQIDPVEKRRLKQAYLQEDIDCLMTFQAVYQLMAGVMKYKRFGGDIRSATAAQLEVLRERVGQQDKNVPLRPTECLYAKLVQDVLHFLNTNCSAHNLQTLLSGAEFGWKIATAGHFGTSEAELAKTSCHESAMKLTLWLDNAQRFVQHILKPYSGYYEDFMQPLQCALQQLAFGFEGLKSVMEQLDNGIAVGTDERSYLNLHHEAYVHRLVESFASFPNTQLLKPVTNNQPSKQLMTSTIASNTPEKLLMLELRLDMLHKHVHIAKEFTTEASNCLIALLAEYNQCWQTEEQALRRRKAEDESLYVQKTKCADEDEALLELQEIETHFPTHIEEDYGEYLALDTLEQTKKLPKANTKTQSTQVLNEMRIAHLAENVIELLTQYAHVPYHAVDKVTESLDFVATAKARLQTFTTLYTRHKLCLNDWLDEQSYNGLCLAVTLQERLLKELPANASNSSKSPQRQDSCYNFYKDSNIPEIVACTDLLARINALVEIQLALYPEHATLLDIQQIIARILKLPSDAPLVRFSTGFQLLRQKLAMWNELAHKQNHLRNEEIELAEYVQKWMRLELQCWRNCLNQTQRQVEMRAYRYWFYIYNLMYEHLKGEQVDASYSDIKYAERRFGDCEVLDAADVAQKSDVDIMDVIRILRQFIEAANYGDFHVRLRLLQAFEVYLQCCEELEYWANNRDSLIAVLRNLQLYYGQFAQEIAESRQSMRAPIEKKLKEFVKIESYNKDLSYFSMRSNVTRVHRQLNKFLKEYRQQLEEKITPVFQPQDGTAKDYNFENVKGKALRFDAKVKYNLLIDVKHFMANEKLRVVAPTDIAQDTLLSKVGKHFLTSRNIVKAAIQHAAYPQMIMALDELLAAQLDRCEHLRNLNVDRTKERPKQVLEAKQILQQKRKGLTDLFKLLTQLGLSYKSGLLEQTLSTELVDFKLPPFCVRNMLCSNAPKDKQLICSNMLQLYENIDRYYAKSVFKLRLLQNIMMKPLSELGPPNIERIKGFAVDLFLLVQKQRNLLATSTGRLHELKRWLKQLKYVANIGTAEQIAAEQLDFAGYNSEFRALKRVAYHTRFVMEQFALLLDCAPAQPASAQQVFTNDTGALSKSTPLYGSLAANCTKVLDVVKQFLTEISKHDLDFVSYNQLAVYKQQHAERLALVTKMKESCQLPNTKDYLPLAQPLTALLNYSKDTLDSIQKESTITELAADDHVKFEQLLSNMTYSILLSLQKIYKQHPNPTLDSSASSSNEAHASPKKRNTTSENELELQEQHLKKLHNALDTDWCNLNMDAVVEILDVVTVALESLPSSNVKLQCIRELATVLPLLEQFSLMAEYQLLQQLGAHKITAKMLSITLTVFVEISSKGFCVPPDLMHDEEQGERKQDQKEGEGFGLEDGTGEKDASDKIESEDQLDDAKRPEDRKDEANNEQKQDDCKEEKGIEMSEDFEGKMQDIEKPENEEDDSGESENEDELNKEMGETEEGAEKLDEQIWGDDEEPEKPEEDEQEMQDEDNGKGTKDEDDSHNDLDAKNDAAKNKDDTDEHDKNGLDATNEASSEQDKRKQQKQDIDNMKDPEVDEDQTNPYHNELEEPPEPEEMDLGDMNNEDDNEGGDEEHDTENPFDIDSMKQNMPDLKETGDENADEDDENKEKDAENGNESDDSDDSDGEQNLKQDKNEAENGEKEDDVEKQEDEANNVEPETQKRGELNEEEKEAEKENETEKLQQEEKPEEHAAAQDKSSKEQNVQSMPNTEDKASADQAPNEEEETNIKQDQKLDEQETGEEKDGVGQAENEDNDGGHQGIAETKETVSKEERKNERQTKEKRKQGRTNEERSLGEAEKQKLKQLKTIDKLKEDDNKDSQTPDEADNKDETEAEEYQHVKEPKNTDKTTLDNATEEQSKKLKHQEDEEMEENAEESNENETNEELNDINAEEQEMQENVEELNAEKNENKSDKTSKSEKTQERTETQEQMEVEGEIVPTITVPRCDDTTAHCNKDILLDSTTLAEELSATELLEMRKLYQQQLTGGNKLTLPQHEHYETWQTISNRMSQNARELCEQLRLILEPTKCTRLKGDYRTGRRINMKKIIPYIASQFRKDKIWLRRTKPAQRDYKITIAIDDSKSMHHNNSKTLTLEAISLVSQALTLLESGRLSVVSFGETPKIILNHTEQFDGPKLVNALNFAQDKTKIADLLDFIRTVNTEEGATGSDNGLFENLLLVLSDGRNIFSEGRTKVKNAIKLARLQRIFLVYIIIDNPENKNSILDIQTMEMLPDKRINIKSYLDDFPIPYYVIVRDLNQLPLVLSEAMRQWFELVNSEQ